MKWIIILLVLLSCSPGPQEVDTNRISFADGRVSFIPPSGFRPLTQEQIDQKYPRGNAPKHVFANESQSVSVAISFSPANVSPEQLPEFKDAMEEMLPRMVPGLQWQIKEIIEMKGRRWVHFKFTSHAIDTDVINDMYMTPFDGKPLIISYNSVVSEYERVKEHIEESKNSIEVK